jgi:HK97 family phage major capsid protein
MKLTTEQKLALLKKTIEGVQENKGVAMDTAESGAGSNFVDTGMASNVLLKVRDEQTVLSKLPAPLMMPTASWTIPVEGGDPTFYATGEQTAGPGTEYSASNAGTSSVTLVSKKLSAITYLSGELDEDSIVSIRPYVESKIAKSYSETLDKSIINGDTTTASTGNVNSDDAAPTAGTYYLHFDGLRKSAITNSKTVNAGTLDITDFRAARKLLGKKGLNPAKLLWIVGAEVYYKILGLTQVETIEKFGSAATIVDGVLKFIDGIEVVTNGDVPLTEADGKVSATPGNNTLGTAVLVYKEDIITGFKRELRTNVEYLPQLDQFRISAHTRFAIKIKDTDSVSALINVTV